MFKNYLPRLACMLLAFSFIQAVAQSNEEARKASATSIDATDAKSDTEPVSTISVKVKVVNVLATVRDKHGQVIPNLEQSDFTLEEDGRPQTIRYFSQETDLPLTLGLLVDTSMSQRRVLEQERDASYDFLDRVLREDKDMAFVIHFDHEVELLQDLTSSRKKLESTLRLLQTPGRGQWGGRAGGRGGAGTLLYDGVLLAS